MRVGARSLLFGVHQVVWHPVTVLIAWWMLYGRPSGREAICIVVHDWGYWTCGEMDGPEGLKHPEGGAKVAGWLLGPTYRDLVLYHSRGYAVPAGVEPSRLCWADKASVLFDPPWWYLARARLSGELGEYRREAALAGHVPLSASDAEWFAWLRGYMAEVVRRHGLVSRRAA